MLRLTQTIGPGPGVVGCGLGMFDVEQIAHGAGGAEKRFTSVGKYVHR